MNHTHYQIAKGYLKETHQQAYRDYLARSLRPSLRQNVAAFLAKLALWLEPQNKPAEVVPFQS
jgi:hypothetical protein